MRKVNLPLSVLTAQDVMADDVLVLSEDMSLATAACLLSQAQITGAPVVNENGRCVGVLSATDFLRRASEKDAVGPPCVGSDSQMVARDGENREDVRDYMSVDPVLVAPETALSTLANRVLNAHKHRAIVVDERGRPIGIVSASDVLAAVGYVDASVADFDAEICCVTRQSRPE